MAEIRSFPNNQDEFRGAEEVMKWFHGRSSGVFAAGGNCAVAPLSSPGMAVSVSDGTGWIANVNQDGIVWWNEHEAINTTKLQLTVNAADGVLNRIDRVIVEWKTTNYVDWPEIKILKGTPASKAAAPALTNNSTVRQISLARISVAAGTTAITASMITDERLDPAVCGLVTDNLEVDTSMMQAQFSAFLSQMERELENVKGTDAHVLKTGDIMTGPLAIPEPTETSHAANKGYVDTRNPYNYIHNADFSRFVAQAGIGGKHGNQAYAGDRWILDSGTVTGEANADGEGYSNITLNGTIRQIIANAPAVATPGIEMISGTATITYANGAVTVTSSGGVIGFVKLFEGEYTADNMPKGKPKGYGAELAECRRYFINLFAERSYEYFHIGQAYSTTEAIINIPLATAMRINPSVTYSEISLTSATMGLKTVTDITVQRASEMGTMLYVVASGLTAGNATLLSKKDTTGYAHLSADL